MTLEEAHEHIQTIKDCIWRHEMNKAMKLIARHEGSRDMMYEDSLGIETIGIGHNLRDKPISQAAIKQIFEDDINQVIDEVTKAFPWFVILTDVRKAVVLDMVFNMGLAGFSKFKNTISHIQSGTYSAAALEMLDSRWADQVGSRATELSEMMKTGKWS